MVAYIIFTNTMESGEQKGRRKVEIEPMSLGQWNQCICSQERRGRFGITLKLRGLEQQVSISREKLVQIGSVVKVDKYADGFTRWGPRCIFLSRIDINME